MSTALLVVPFGIVLLITLFGFRLKLWASSDPPGSYIKPGIFYCVEDLAAVDFGHGKEFRQAMRARYVCSPLPFPFPSFYYYRFIHNWIFRWIVSKPFRSLMFTLTLYWGLQSLLYFGITAAVTWASPFDFAFGWVLGQFFVWAAVATVGSEVLRKWGLRKERTWWESTGRELAGRGDGGMAA